MPRTTVLSTSYILGQYFLTAVWLWSYWGRGWGREAQSGWEACRGATLSYKKMCNAELPIIAIGNLYFCPWLYNREEKESSCLNRISISGYWVVQDPVVLSCNICFMVIWIMFLCRAPCIVFRESDQIVVSWNAKHNPGEFLTWRIWGQRSDLLRVFRRL